MYVAFLHGPPAVGKYTVALELSALTGLPLFHNHLAVDTARCLFAFGTPAFNTMRATIWRTAFDQAAAAGTSFIFTFNPEATVDPALIAALQRTVQQRRGSVHYIQLECSPQTVLARLGSASRQKFLKLTDAARYQAIEAQGGFAFPPLPPPLITIDTDRLAPADAAAQIAQALGAAEAAATS